MHPPENYQLQPLPLISVAMPIYNAGKYLRLAVISMIEQTYTNWELFIVDDGSTDGALESISDLVDSRITIIADGRNCGLAMRLNQVIDLAQGKYLARMDQDDYAFPDRFTKQVQLLESNSQLDLVTSSMIAICEKDQMIGKVPSPVNHHQLCATPWKGLAIPHPTWMGKIEWFRKHKYKIPGPYFCEDQELLLRTYNNSQFSAVSDYVFAYRIREKRNIARVIKTRWELLKIQSSFFVLNKKWQYLVLAWLYCLILIIRDLWWHAWNSRSIAIKAGNTTVNDDLYRKWQETIARIKEHHAK